MSNSKTAIPDYIKQLYMEATFRSSEYNDKYIYGFVTYAWTNLKGTQINKAEKYNVQARGRIPITENEFLDMSLNTGKDDKLLDFHMTYVRTFTGKDHTLLGRKFKLPVSSLNIRTDIGPHRGSPHIDVEIFGVNKGKIEDMVVKQDEEFKKYESAISAVFMQVERISNPFIGPQYWLSPAQIFPEIANTLSELKQVNKISSPLNVIARAINIKIYEETRTQATINEGQFWDIAESQVQSIREKERQLGGSLDIAEVNYSTDMSVLPFLFFVPHNAKYSLSIYIRWFGSSSTI